MSSKQVHKLVLYQPHPGQIRGHASRSRFNALNWGRQSGKTTYGLNKIIDRAWTGARPYDLLGPNTLRHQDSVYWYILQTYDAAHVAFKRLYKIYRDCPSVFDKKPNESDLTMRLKHGAEIGFKSGGNYEDLRVETLDGVVIDEYRQQHPDLWPQVIRPMLARKNGWADILSTPNGFDHFFELCEDARVNPDWRYFHNPSTVAPWWTEKEVMSARSTMTVAEFNQEIMAEFTDIARGKAYINFGEHNITSQSPFGGDSLVNKYMPIIVAPDFNLNPMAWGIGQISKAVKQAYWFDEIHLNNSHTQEASKALADKLSPYKNQDIWICGDATGKAGQRAAAGESDYACMIAILKERGFKRILNVTPDSNPLVKDRINTMNMYFKNSMGDVNQWVHPQAKNMIKDFQRVLWKDGQFVLDSGPKKEYTHSSDGPGYAVCEIMGHQGVKRSSGIAVINRI